MKFKLPSHLTKRGLLWRAQLIDSFQTSGFGFRQFKSTYRSLAAYRNDSLGIVVKRQNCILDHRTTLSVRVPTIRLGQGWVAQPIVKKVNLKKAHDILQQRLSKFKGIRPDLHTGNIGWYNGKPVMFDW